MFIDTHCHFDFSVFDSDRPEVWKNSQSLGVMAMMIPGVDPDQWACIQRLSCQHDRIYHSVGLHPLWLSSWLSESSSMDSKLAQGGWGDARLSDSYTEHRVNARLECFASRLHQFTETFGLTALGECGLDKTIAVPLAIQQRFFDYQVELAARKDVPLIIHARKTHNEVLSTLKRFAPDRGGVIHGFSGSLALAERYWSMGVRIGVGGTITYPRAAKTRETVTRLPLEALVLETDAPDMPISGRQGQRNSPERIPDIAALLAQLRGERVEHIARATTDNARRLFGLEFVL